MAVFPNSDASAFSSWLQSQTWARLTTSQSNVLDEIIAAAAGSTSVTNNTWRNYLIITSPFFQAWQNNVYSQVGAPGTVIDWSLSCNPVGWSSFSLKRFLYNVNGTLVTCSIWIEGTSDSSAKSATLPFALNALDALPRSLSMQVRNNGTVSTSPGLWTIGAGSSVVNFSRDGSGLAWTASGIARVAGTFQYFK